MAAAIGLYSQICGIYCPWGTVSDAAVVVLGFVEGVPVAGIDDLVQCDI